MRPRLMVLAAQVIVALEVCWMPVGGNVRAAGGQSCNVTTPAITLTASPGQERFQVVSWDSVCHLHVSGVMDATPELIAKYRLHDQGTVAGPSAVPSPAPSANAHPLTHGDYTSTCRTSQSLHDMAQLVLTEDDVFQTWTYNGSYIDGVGSGHTGTSYLNDGWQLLATSFTQSYAGWPYHFAATGGASFMFTFGTFAHSQTNQDALDAIGHCVGAFTNSGTAGVPNGYYTYDLSVY